MRDPFIEGLKARVARDKKISAEIKAGFEYLRDNIGEMSSEQQASALQWLTSHAKLGHFGQEEVNRFLKGDNNPSKPNDYPDDNSSDDDKGDDEPADEQKDKGKKAKKRAKPCNDDDSDDTGDRDDKRDRGDDNARRAARYATGDAVLAAEIRAGAPVTAAQILYCGRVRRGEVASPSLAPKGNDPVARAARDILNAGCRRRGEQERF
jgi:hypothetical protein